MLALNLEMVEQHSSCNTARETLSTCFLERLNSAKKEKGGDATAQRYDLEIVGWLCQQPGRDERVAQDV